jgi:hypothetical protein
MLVSRVIGKIWIKFNERGIDVIDLGTETTLRWPRWLVPMACLASALLLLAASPRVDASTSKQSPYAGFPLYKDVSGSGAFATLDEGQLPNQTRWGVYASRVGAGRRGYEQPCLSLARITQFGEYTDAHACGPLAPTGDQAVPTHAYIAGSYREKKDGPVVGETVLGMSFRPTVRSVVLEFVDGRQLQRRTRLFNSKQQKKTKLPPFRYVAVALQDDVCAGVVVGYSKDGSELFSAETGLCSMEP